MRLESIELRGFKSFANKTKIEFDDQITAIVGPNGSGKSNISDAIRRVLGEQSAKSLRGSKMNDVIFQGGENKNSLNLCEVALNFSDNEKSLNTPYEKIKISRRIYRDGENEYKLNGNRVRLKDIRELFLDTGVGKEGYSIISQGRIDEIVSSSNYNRRAIFEEASGISKHKYRRDESEKKLIKVNDDLEIIEREWEYKKNDLDRLSNEAENYKKFLNLSDLINHKSYNYLVNKSKKLLERRSKIEETINSLKQTIEDKKSRLNSINQKLKPFHENFNKLNDEIIKTEEKLKTYQKSIEKSENQITLNEQKYNYNLKDLDRIDQNILNINDKKENLNIKLNASQINLKKSLENIDSYNEEIVKLEETIENINRENIKLAAEIDTLKIQKDKLSQNILDFEISQKTNALLFEKRKRERVENQEKIKSIDLEIISLKDALDELNTNKKKLFKIIEKNQSHISSMSLNIEDIIKNIQKLEKESTQNNVDLKTYINEYKFNETLIAKNEGYFYSVQEFLNKTQNTNLNNNYLGTLANLITVKSGYEEIIDNLMGATLQNIVTYDKNSSRELINFVNYEKLGRITFLPIDSIKSNPKNKPNEKEVIAMAYDLISFDNNLSGIINHFLGSTVVVKDIDNAISLSNKIRGYRIITLNLDVINSRGSMVAGSDKNRKGNINLLNRNKKKENLKDKILKLKEHKKSIEDHYIKLIEEKKDRTLDYDILNTKNTQYRENLTEINNSINNLSYKIESLEKRKDEIDAFLANEDIEDLETDIDSLRAKNKRVIEILDIKSQKHIKNKEDNITNNSNLIKLQNKLDIVNRDLNMLRNLISEIEVENENLISSKKIEDKLKIEIEKGISDIKTQDDKLKKSIDFYKNQFKELSDKLIKDKDKLKETSDKNKILIEETKIIEEEINDYNIKKVKDEYELISINKDYDNLIDEIRPFITIEIGDLEEKYNDKELSEVNKSELITLQKNINNIGYYTIDSIDRYEEISDEFKFIDSQLNDLKNSKADIEKMIKTLENEMREEFKKNFHKIDENFSRIFKILFMGGDAKLTLDDNNELNAGIEIVARPPSKSPKSISLLSGGEKALTAVALLFAIFEINPAPFAILDEIDAALDEINIKRYIEYLKTLSLNSQFIMITHRQTTMQLAETIHGVTIDEEGISKVYSIDFKEN